MRKVSYRLRSSHSNCRFLYMPDRVSPDHPAEGSAAPPKGGWQFRCCWKQRNDMPPWSTPWSVQRLSLSLIGQPGHLAANPTGNGNDGATIASTTCSRGRQIPCLISCNQYWRQNTPETEVVAPQSPAPRDRKRNRWLFSIIYSRKTNWKWKWWRSCSFLTITRDESFMTISL